MLKDDKYIIEVYAHNEFEATHRWPDCDIEEVSYLKNEHRHIFKINSYKVVDHNNRDIEFIVLKHRVNDWLEKTYPSHKLGHVSCEMLAIQLIKEFGLSMCEVSEDGENGAVVYSKEKK